MNTPNMEAFMSQMRIVSLGYVSENKALSDNWISVVPIELVPDLTGDILDSIESIQTSGLNYDGSEYSVKVTTSQSIRAHWLPMGSNRVTAPDLRRGEIVYLWQFADVDAYYWSPTGLNDEYRRLETVIYAWSATSEEDVELALGKNMYSLEVSTHSKNITLKTTKANGEPYAYTIQLNTEAGILFIADDDGQVVELHSAERRIRAINKDKTEVTLDKTKIYVYAKDEIKAETDGNIIGNAKNNISVDAGKTITATAGRDIIGKAGSNISVTAGKNMDAKVGGNATLNISGSLTGSIKGGVTITGGGAKIVMQDGVISMN